MNALLCISVDCDALIEDPVCVDRCPRCGLTGSLRAFTPFSPPAIDAAFVRAEIRSAMASGHPELALALQRLLDVLEPSPVVDFIQSVQQGQRAIYGAPQ